MPSEDTRRLFLDHIFSRFMSKDAILWQPELPPNLERGDADSVVNDAGFLEMAIGAAVNEATLGAFVAHPGSPSTLVAVSPKFQEVTGYTQEEVLGKRCFFLEDNEHLTPEQKLGIGVGFETGSLFSSVIFFQKADGTRVLSRVSFQGLVISQSKQAQDDLWIVVGVLEDFTHLEEADLGIARHAENLQLLGKRIHKLFKHFTTTIGVYGTYSSQGLCIVQDVQWKPGQPVMPPNSSLAEIEQVDDAHNQDAALRITKGARKEESGARELLSISARPDIICKNLPLVAMLLAISWKLRQTAI